jgi:hypothetical protein
MHVRRVQSTKMVLLLPLLINLLLVGCGRSLNDGEYDITSVSETIASPTSGPATLADPSQEANEWAATAVPPDTTPREARQFVGMMGALPQDLARLKEWGVSTVEYHGVRSTETLDQMLNDAKANDMYLFVRATNRDEIQSQPGRLDLSKVETVTRNLFGNTSVGSDPNFLGYWILDEACHANKWDVTAADLAGLYSRVKAVNPDIQVIINFGNLDCLAEIIAGAEPGLRLSDVAMFTITEKKMTVRRGEYIQDECQNAQAARAYDRLLKVVPQIAVYESTRHDSPIGAANWVRDTGLEVVQSSCFDGLLYYPFNPLSDWIGRAIVDVADDPEYIEAFKEVFAAAIEG